MASGTVGNSRMANSMAREVEGRQEMSGTEYDRGDKVVSIWSDGEISERQT